MVGGQGQHAPPTQKEQAHQEEQARQEEKARQKDAAQNGAEKGEEAHQKTQTGQDPAPQPPQPPPHGVMRNSKYLSHMLDRRLAPPEQHKYGEQQDKTDKNKNGRHVDVGVQFLEQ